VSSCRATNANAIEPPQHDHENAVHECVECFERAFERMMREVRGG